MKTLLLIAPIFCIACASTLTPPEPPKNAPPVDVPTQVVWDQIYWHSYRRGYTKLPVDPPTIDWVRDDAAWRQTPQPLYSYLCQPEAASPTLVGAYYAAHIDVVYIPPVRRSGTKSVWLTLCHEMTHRAILYSYDPVTAGKDHLGPDWKVDGSGLLAQCVQAYAPEYFDGWVQPNYETSFTYLGRLVTMNICEKPDGTTFNYSLCDLNRTANPPAACN